MIIPRRWTAQDRADLVLAVLDRLPEPDREPISTPTIRRMFPALDDYEREAYVRNALDRLCADGWAEKISGDSGRVVYWRRTAAGQRAHRDRQHTHVNGLFTQPGVKR